MEKRKEITKQFILKMDKNKYNKKTLKRWNRKKNQKQPICEGEQNRNVEKRNNEDLTEKNRRWT
jgi:hypothetical protein